MEGRKADDTKAGKDSASEDKAAAGSESLHAKLSADSQITPAAATNQGAGEANKFLPAVALWTEGAQETPTDIGPGYGWSAIYAANFDREGEAPHIDLAHVLGLPNGADQEQVALAAKMQGDDLLKDLLA